MGDQHTELRSPVAHVVDSDHLVAAELQNASQTVSDNRASEMTNVHVLRNVRRTVVDNNAFTLGWGRHEAVVQDVQDVLSDPALLQVEVDKAGASKLGLLHELRFYACKQMTECYQEGGQW